eukprot:TRINITY_DN9032_c0_g1_i2.p1 TRINITY_DN9032_c0_g1~~TRINITY_DN9032_c0_g1_i2.p1  ORF type:complete len:118 (+),score=22.77 TRINITY_DN9032_c0_g1_i2:61-414(+)
MGDAMSANKEIEADKKARNTVLQMTGWSEETHLKDVNKVLEDLRKQRKFAVEHQKQEKANLDQVKQVYEADREKHQRLYNQWGLRIASLDRLIETNTHEFEEAGGKLDHGCGFGCGQ